MVTLVVTFHSLKSKSRISFIYHSSFFSGTSMHTTWTVLTLQTLKKKKGKQGRKQNLYVVLFPYGSYIHFIKLDMKNNNSISSQEIKTLYKLHIFRFGVRILGGGGGERLSPSTSPVQ